MPNAFKKSLYQKTDQTYHFCSVQLVVDGAVVNQHILIPSDKLTELVPVYSAHHSIRVLEKTPVEKVLPKFSIRNKIFQRLLVDGKSVLKAIARHNPLPVAA